jgi:LCP family protein required for cell wall assembly
MLVPLPTGFGANNGNPLQGLWQTGFQYRVARPVNILVMGIDNTGHPHSDPSVTSAQALSGNSDTMLLLRVDPSDDSVNLLSIPRDTQVDIPGIGITKINDANVQGGATLAARTVSSTLNGAPVDRYVRVSTESFRDLVDLLGGVEVYVPAPMSYVDKTQKLKINLAAGLQTLNGSQAEQFVRFRHDALGDIGRVQRQQTLLKALLKRATNPAVIPRLPGLVAAMQKYIDTNMSLEEMLSLVSAGRKLSQGKFKMVMLPGRFSTLSEFKASYWILNPEGRDRVMQQYFKVNPTATEANSPRLTTALKIAIQNASSQSDAAQKVRQSLVSLGFSNVYVTSDWTERQTQTQIIVQQGDLHGAEELQAALRLGRVEAVSTGDIESDLTIRVGDDWSNRAQ